MIKRLIGLLAALGIVALLVFVVLGRHDYRSMLGNGESPSQTELSK